MRPTPGRAKFNTQREGRSPRTRLSLHQAERRLTGLADVLPPAVDVPAAVDEWNKLVVARPESGTQVLRGKEVVLRTVSQFLSNAKSRMDLCTGTLQPNQTLATEEITRGFLDVMKRGGRLRVIGRITTENVEFSKGLMRQMELRHREGVLAYFGVSDTEYIALPGTQEFNADSPILYSNNELFVKHHQNLFDMLWDTAVPARLRVMELEKGETLGETRVTFSTEEILEAANRFIDETKDEALVIVSREGSITDNLDLFQRIVAKASTEGVRVRILGRFSDLEETLIKEFQEGGVQVRRLAPGKITNLSLGIYDRKGMGIAQYIYPETVTTGSGSAYLSGVTSTNRQTIAGIAAIFDSLWEEGELRQRAELLQDILTHDIRNYNQISRANADLLQNDLTDERLKRFVTSIIKAVDGSTDLIQKARMLANVLTEQETAKLSVVNLSASLERSLTLIKNAYRGRPIELRSRGFPEALVRADSLLDQVFVNILSNAVKYTPGAKVYLEVELESEKEERVRGSARQESWKVTVSDMGQGIPDEMKEGSFTRYLGKARGRGLGLSIARALVVDRYSGRIQLRNRIQDDYRRGTIVEVWLPKV